MAPHHHTNHKIEKFTSQGEPKEKPESSNIINRYLTQQDKKTTLYISLSSIAVLIFLLIVLFAPVHDKVFQVFYPKPLSHAASLPVDFSDVVGNPVTQTFSPIVNVVLTSPWPAQLTSAQIEPINKNVAGISAYIIYDDALQNGWTDGSYDSTNNYNNTAPIYTGSQSISAKAKAWGALEFNSPNKFSTTPYTHVQFSIQATQANENLVVYAEGAGFRSFNKKAQLFNYGGYPSTTKWTTYTIPLSDINAVNKTIADISIQNNTGGNLPTFYVDQVQLINISSLSPTATNATTPTVKPTATVAPTATSTPTPLYTASVILAEDVNFTSNIKTITPVSVNPLITTYTFSTGTAGPKTLYAKFNASDGTTSKISSNTIQLVVPTSSPTVVPTNNPSITPTTSPTPISFTGKSWYVSKSGTNGTGDTWVNAWNELNQIKWTSINPGDRIIIDGGATTCSSPFNAASAAPYDYALPKPGNMCGMMYTTSLSVGKSGSSTSPISIQLAQDAGHNGTAVFFGGRTATLPYCNQSSYTNQTTGVLSSGITLGNNQYVNLDGIKRSGIVIYGFTQGITTSSSTSNITMRNMEIFDNGVATLGNKSSSFGSPAQASPTGWWSDGWAIALNGGDSLTFDRLLLHDNGQDVFHGGNTVNNLAITNSWLYASRENPSYPGYSFNTGQAGVCTHPDAFQLWSGGPNSGLSIQNTIVGPYVNQGLYPTDTTTPQYNNVTLGNVLFLNVASDAINTVDSAPTGWKMSNLTFYRYGKNPSGSYCCSIDGNNWPSSDSITNSISYGGDINAPGLTGSNNIYYNTNGATLAGGTNTDPQFTSGLTTNTPHFAQIQAVNLTPTCSTCSGKGSLLHTTQDLLNTIDSLNISNH